MTLPRPPDALNTAHLKCLVEIVRSDSFIADVHAEPDDSIAPALVFATCTRLVKRLTNLGQSPEIDRELVSQVLIEASELLDLPRVRATLAGPSLTVLQRTALLVLHNIDQSTNHPDLTN
jgi:hypothetical protein